MSNGARQCAVALIASLRSPSALRISNQLTMATGVTTIKSHVLKRGGGDIYANDDGNDDNGGKKRGMEKRGMGSEGEKGWLGGDNCGGTGFVVYNNQIVKRKE